MVLYLFPCIHLDGEKASVKTLKRLSRPLRSHSIQSNFLDAHGECCGGVLRFAREEAKIQAWENHEKAKAEAEMRRIEVNSASPCLLF